MILDKGWRAVGRLTLDATWSVTRTVATRSMIPSRGGLIVFLGFSPLRGVPGFAHACAARAAVCNLASGLALEWSQHGIRSVCVAPGTIGTDALFDYGADAVRALAAECPARPAWRTRRGGESDRSSRHSGGCLYHWGDAGHRRRRRCLGIS
jgi:NAD(P)-dependent dehydrogenase (short-subunit alcohol dehydrogenase family)